MNKYVDEHKIAAEFEQLRQAEQGLTPRFSSLLQAASHNKPRFRMLQPVAGFAVVVLALSIWALIGLRPDTIEIDPLDTADNLQLSSIDELPTDFLLETPWSQMASLGPEPQLLDLPYEFMEELPDEL